MRRAPRGSHQDASRTASLLVRAVRTVVLAVTPPAARHADVALTIGPALPIAG